MRILIEILEDLFVALILVAICSPVVVPMFIALSYIARLYGLPI